MANLNTEGLQMPVANKRAAQQVEAGNQIRLQQQMNRRPPYNTCGRGPDRRSICRKGVDCVTKFIFGQGVRRRKKSKRRNTKHKRRNTKRKIRNMKRKRRNTKRKRNRRKKTSKRSSK